MQEYEYDTFAEDNDNSRATLSPDTKEAIEPVLGFFAQGDTNVAETLLWELFLAEADRVRQDRSSLRLIVQNDGRREEKKEKEGIIPAADVVLSRLLTPLLDVSNAKMSGSGTKQLVMPNLNHNLKICVALFLPKAVHF